MKLAGTCSCAAVGWFSSSSPSFALAGPSVLKSITLSAALVHLPRWVIATVGLALIAGHNLFDGIKAEQLGAAAPLWNLLHQPGAFDLTRGFKLIVLYPLIPWIGVMVMH